MLLMHAAFMRAVCKTTQCPRLLSASAFEAAGFQQFTEPSIGICQPSLLMLFACWLQDAAAIGQGASSSSGRQQAPPPPDPEPDTTGAPQMIVDPETGNLVLDKASLTVQAQPREEYVRRDEGHHDLVNSQTYLKRGATNKWTPEETDEFWAVSSLCQSASQ